MARDFDVCLILHAEHSFNASTFAGREVASDPCHIYASVAAAMVHSPESSRGGQQRGDEDARRIGEVGRAKAWVSGKMGKGGKIMGMGHAVYHTEDPGPPSSRSVSGMAGRWYDNRWCGLAKQRNGNKRGVQK